MPQPLPDATIPMKAVGPLKMHYSQQEETISVPLATYESPLWPSVERGARLSLKSGGIHVTVVDACMTRSLLVEAATAQDAHATMLSIQTRHALLQKIVSDSSRFATLEKVDFQIVGNLLYLRLKLQTGDAAGHNMVTKAADAILSYLLQHYPLKHLSVSGNYCCDKKVSAVNGILGRGKSVIAEMFLSNKLCHAYLKAAPQTMVDLHIKKNLIGSILAGSVRSANAHAANMLLAFYLATGQDAANIVEGSQGIVHAEVREQDLYFSVSLPNIIVGSVGNGKELAFVQENLQKLGCLEKREVGENSRRLAAIAAATVLCGELSLLAAQTNQGELMHAHLKLERN